MKGTMHALVKAQPARGFELREVPVPPIGSNDVLIQTRAASICGTDLHIYNWDPWAQNRMKPPLIVGHEFCGDVLEAGSDVTTVKVGDFVSAESHIVDNTCDLCRTGNAHICRNTKIIGVDRDGCFADYVALPAVNAWVNPPTMPTDIAVLQENFGNAVHTALATPVVSRKVLVTGCGPVGLMTIAVARAAGARSIYASDISAYRLALAKKMGADVAINVKEQDLVSVVLDGTQGEGVDVLFEMSGAPSAIRDGFTLLKAGGAAVLLGLPSRPLEFDLANLVIMKGVTLFGMRQHARALAAFRRARSLKPGWPELENYIGSCHRVRGELDEAGRAFEAALEADERNSNALFGLGALDMARGDLPAAERYLLRAADLDPDNPFLRYRLGRLRVLQDRTSEAAAEFERAVALRPVYPRAHYNLALAYERLGRHAEAERALATFRDQERAERAVRRPPPEFKFAIPEDEE